MTLSGLKESILYRFSGFRFEDDASDIGSRRLMRTPELELFLRLSIIFAKVWQKHMFLWESHSGAPFSIINGPNINVICTFPKGIFSRIGRTSGLSSRLDRWLDFPCWLSIGWDTDFSFSGAGDDFSSFEFSRGKGVGVINALLPKCWTHCSLSLEMSACRALICSGIILINRQRA